MNILGATHIPMLVRAFELSEGDVLEMGTGLYSTTILKWLCEVSGRTLYSYENDLKWYNRAIVTPVPFHKVIKVEDWDKAEIERPWGLAFIDHKSGKRRHIDIQRLANFAEYIVIHDTNPEAYREYHYERIWPLFKYIYHFKKYSGSYTSVVSNFHSLEKFE